MAWSLPWPFRKREARGSGGPTDAARPTAPAAAAAVQRSDAGEPGWASLPPLRGAAAVPPVTARSVDFAREIETAVTVPVALAPLGHDRSADGPGGLVSAAARPKPVSPVVARVATGHAASAERPFRLPFRRTTQVQRAPAVASVDSEGADGEPATVSRAAAAGATDEPSVSPADTSMPALPVRRLASVASAATSPGPAASLVRAPDVPSRVDGTMGAAVHGASGGSAPAGSSPARSLSSAAASSAAPRPDGPAALAATVLPPMPGHRPDPAPPLSPAGHAPVQRAPGPGTTRADDRPTRLTVGQVRRLGLGMPFSGPPPTAAPIVARVAGAPAAAVMGDAGSDAAAGAPTVISPPVEGAREGPVAAGIGTPAGDPVIPIAAGPDVERTAVEHAPLVSRAPMAAPPSPDVEARDVPAGGPAVARSTVPAASAGVPRVAGLRAPVQWSAAGPGHDQAGSADRSEGGTSARRDAPMLLQRAIPATAAPMAGGPSGDSAMPAATAVSPEPLASRRTASSPVPAGSGEAGDDPARGAMADTTRGPALQRLASAPSTRIQHRPLVARPGLVPVTVSGDPARPASAHASATPESSNGPDLPPVARSVASVLAPASAGGPASDPAPPGSPPHGTTPSGQPAVQRATVASRASAPVRESRPLVSRGPSLLAAHPDASAGSLTVDGTPTASRSATGDRAPAGESEQSATAVHAVRAVQRTPSAPGHVASATPPLVLRMGREAPAAGADATRADGQAPWPGAALADSQALHAARPSLEAPVLARDVAHPGRAELIPAASSAPRATTLQREAEPETGATPGAPAAGAGAAAPPAAGDAPAGIPTGDRELDDLAHRLYDRIRSRLRLELLIDRERTGTLSDFS